ncbi:MAG TPA: right-handed parallel beta-helix repeat-containing protein [Clostridia bacterium]|nr:right-handed parallel beta-helix repeat-containing protein [Clostridia bacterium]
MARFPLFRGILLGFILLVLFSSAAFAQALYVSPQGDDAGEGSLEHPLKTLCAAQERLRKIKGKEPVQVFLREGVYELSAPLAFNHRDRDNVTFQSYPGETAVLTGARAVEGWTLIERDGQILWKAAYRGDTPMSLYGPDGERPSARWPKTGTLAVASSLGDTSTLFISHRAFLADPAQLPERLDGARLRLTHAWKDELSGIRAYDAAGGRLDLNRQTSMTVFPGDPFWLENVLYAPFAAGEWAYDASEGALYYAPLPGEAIGATLLHIAVQTRLITLEGVSGIAFEDLVFARTNWAIPHRDREPDFAQAAYDADACVFVRDSQDISFARCTFEAVGAGCIRLDRQVRNASISACVFREIGAQAVFIHGRNLQNEAQITRSIVLSDNRVEGYGRRFLNAAAILIVHARDVSVLHNEIRDGFYSAISGGWVWGTGFQVTDNLQIQNNRIEDVGQGMLSDMGGIYLLGAQPHTVVSGNVISGVTAAVYGGWGIYLDEGASGITVTRNLVYQCSHQGFHQHNGVNNLVQNNIFAYNLGGQVGASNRSGDGTFVLRQNVLAGEDPFFYRKYGIERMELDRNVFYYVEETPFADAEGGDFTLLDDAPARASGFEPWTVTAGIRTP